MRVRRGGTPRVCLVALVSAFLAGSFEAGAGQTGEQAPTAPTVQQRDVKSLSEEKPVQQWKPGDPVRVIEDLREDGTPEPDKEPTRCQDQTAPKPIVRGPVAPQVMEGRVDQLPKTTPYKEGDPVRVVPDLKESAPKE